MRSVKVRVISSTPMLARLSSDRRGRERAFWGGLRRSVFYQMGEGADRRRLSVPGGGSQTALGDGAGLRDHGGGTFHFGSSR